MTLSVTYKADVVAVAGAARFLDNLDIVGVFDLERIARWSGATAHLQLLNNSGAAPNDVAGTLQGIDNIEVARQRGKVYQAWIEQAFADDRASLRVGLYDLNSEFYVTEAAGLLMAPAFGIGSELASTGPNGPSIFPSTAIAARLEWRPADTITLRGAFLNAHAGVIGDPDSVNFDFTDGALVIGEAAFSGPVNLSVGAWRYTERQDDVRDVDGAGAPRRRLAQGAYASLERKLTEGAGPHVTGFVRVGFSDGDTTPFAGGWQSGVAVEGIMPRRPDSQMSIGVQQGVLASKLRSNERDAGRMPDRAESSIEVTYSDRIHPRVLVQPDVQFFPNPGADSGREATWVGALRVTLEL